MSKKGEPEKVQQSYGNLKIVLSLSMSSLFNSKLCESLKFDYYLWQ